MKCGVVSAFLIVILFSCLSNSNIQLKPVSMKFKEPLNTAVFTTKFGVIEKKDITRVSHDKEDGAWQFFSDDKFNNFEDVVKLVSLGQIIQLDSTMLEMADLPAGSTAHRKFKGDTWIIEEDK